MKKDSKPSNKVKGKMAALQGLHKMASDMMGSDVADMKKVSVLAKDKKGLKKGLKTAEKLVDKTEGSEPGESAEEC